MSGLIQSYSGLAVDVLNLKPEQVRFEDIPHTLAQKVRFAGHLREMGYSVAQHCVHGAEFIGGPARGGDYTREQLRLKLAFLLHECDEVYLPDIPAPIKPFLMLHDLLGTPTTWESLGKDHTRAILKAIGHEDLEDLVHSAEVKAMDRSMLTTEKRDLRLVETDPLIIHQETTRYHGAPVPNFKITRVWAPIEAKHEFRMLYFTLKEQLER